MAGGVPAGRPLPGRDGGQGRLRGPVRLGGELAVGGGLLVGPLGRPRPPAFPGVEDHAVQHQEPGGDDRLAEDHPERVLGEQPHDAHRDGGEDDHPGQPLLGGLNQRGDEADAGGVKDTR